MVRAVDLREMVRWSGTVGYQACLLRLLDVDYQRSRRLAIRGVSTRNCLKP